MKAAPAAGKMKRQAETPAARIAISSERRFSVTNAAMVPNRKMNGSKSRMIDGDCSNISSTRRIKPTSLRPPYARDNSTKTISRTTEAITTSAEASPASVRVRT